MSNQNIDKFKMLLKESIHNPLGSQKINLNDPIFSNDMKEWLRNHLSITVFSQDCYHKAQVLGSQINTSVTLHIGIHVDGEMISNTTAHVTIVF